MKHLLLIALLVGCRAPDFTTRQGVHVYLDCDRDIPTQATLEHLLDFFMDRGPAFLFATRDEIRLSYYQAELYIVCDPWDCGRESLCVGYRRGDNITLDWNSKYWWATGIYHEFWHRVLDMQTSSSDSEHMRDDWHTVDRELPALYREELWFQQR